MGELMLHVALVLCAARLGGEIAERWLRQPAVLGELVAGIAIGPYALGGVELPVVGALFPPGSGPVPVPQELYALAQLGSVILLFVSGLETDLPTFLRFGPRATVVALGGVALPFALGAGGAVALGLADGLDAPAALFMGAILTATSVGITARVLGDLGKLDSPEGVTILAAAVLDDVLGILVLAVVIAVSGGEPAGDLGVVAGRAVGAWVGLSVAFLALASGISRLALRLRAEGAGLAILLAAGLVGAYLADLAGLALIIGAYSAGLALSRTHLRRAFEQEIRVVYAVFVPIFFVVIGMLVDVRSLGGSIDLGVAMAILACVGKVVGAGLPAAAVGFTPIGSLRVGLGMMPRGEVALVIAGAGLAAGLVPPVVFGVAVFVAVATTLAAPPLLVPSFRSNAPGLRPALAATGGPGREDVRRRSWTLSHAAASLLWDALQRHLVDELGFSELVARDVPHARVAQYERAPTVVSIEVRDEGEGRGSLHLEVSGHTDGSAFADEVLRAARRIADQELSRATEPSVDGDEPNTSPDPAV